MIHLKHCAKIIVLMTCKKRDPSNVVFLLAQELSGIVQAFSQTESNKSESELNVSFWMFKY